MAWGWVNDERIFILRHFHKTLKIKSAFTFRVKTCQNGDWEVAAATENLQTKMFTDIIFNINWTAFLPFVIFRRLKRNQISSLIDSLYQFSFVRWQHEEEMIGVQSLLLSSDSKAKGVLTHETRHTGYETNKKTNKTASGSTVIQNTLDDVLEKMLLLVFYQQREKKTF